MSFRATLELGGKTATGIQVPEEIVTALGSGKRPAVRVTINDFTYRSTVAPMGGVLMIPVSAEIREQAGVVAGDEINVTLALGTEPRDVTVSADFSDALDQDPEARRFFDSLSYSNKRRFVLAIDGAKTPETRQRRIASSVAKLRDGKI